MNQVRFPILLGVVGIIAILLAALGILLGGATTYVTMTTDFEQLSEQEFTQGLPEEARKEAQTWNVDLAEIRKIMASKEFRLFVYVMSSFVLLFNIVLMFLGYLFVRVRPGGIWPFISLMILFALYANGLPRMMFMWWPAMESEFSGAWGVGNVGLGPILLSYFWIWGPVLTLVARGRIR